MSNDKKPKIRTRDKRFTLRVSQEEKEIILAAMAATKSKSIVDLVLNSINNSGVILISEVESYNEVFKKAGNLGKNILKGLKTVEDHPEKYLKLIDYLERDDRRNISAMMAFASKLEQAVNTFCIYEENIKCSADLTLKEVIKSKNKKGSKS